jgi:hypothetical protein
MPRVRAFLLALVFAVRPSLAAECRDCLDLSARLDQDTTSPSGVRVLVAGRNHCAETVDGYACRFRVRVLGAGNKEIATQNGSFGDGVAPRATVETLVFVVCDPERVRSVTVEAR